MLECMCIDMQVKALMPRVFFKDSDIEVFLCQYQICVIHALVRHIWVLYRQDAGMNICLLSTFLFFKSKL